MCVCAGMQVSVLCRVCVVVLCRVCVCCVGCVV